jgi:hypothetical protein
MWEFMTGAGVNTTVTTFEWNGDQRVVVHADRSSRRVSRPQTRAVMPGAEADKALPKLGHAAAAAWMLQPSRAVAQGRGAADGRGRSAFGRSEPRFAKTSKWRTQG